MSAAPGVNGAQVRLVLGLRWRLLVRGAKARPLAFLARVGALLIGLGVVLSISFALGVGTAVFQARGQRPQAEVLLHLTYAAGFAWLAFGPLLAFRANEFLDVTKLFHLPVSHRTVFLASLIGALLSPATLMALGPVLAVSLGFGGGVVAVLARLLLGTLVVAVGVAAGQTVLLLLLNTLRSRLWRDVLLVAGPVIGGGVFIAAQVLLRGSDGGLSVILDRVHGWLPWLGPLPSWWGGHAAVATEWIDWLPALGLPLLGWVLVRAAARLQEKAYHGELWAPPRESVRKGVGRGWFSFLPDPVAALAEKDVKLLFREPVVRMMVVQQGFWALFPVALTLWRVLTDEEGPGDSAGVLGGLPFLPLAALIVLMMELGLLMNLLGLEAGGFVHTLLTPVRASQVLTAKVIAHLTLFGGANALLAFVLAVIGYTWAGRPGEGVARGLLDGGLMFAATATALGLCVIASVHLPVRLAARGRRALRQQTTGREGCLMVMKNLLATATVGFAILPGVALVHHADIARLVREDHPIGAMPALTAPLGLLLAAGIAYVVVRAGVQAAAESAEQRVESLIGRLARPEE